MGAIPNILKYIGELQRCVKALFSRAFGPHLQRIFFFRSGLTHPKQPLSFIVRE